jgi:hypothetical protein
VPHATAPVAAANDLVQVQPLGAIRVAREEPQQIAGGRRLAADRSHAGIDQRDTYTSSHCIGGVTGHPRRIAAVLRRGGRTLSRIAGLPNVG